MMKGKIIMKHNIKKITLLSALGATMLVATTPAQAAFQLKVDGQATIVPASQLLKAFPDGGGNLVSGFTPSSAGVGGGFTVGMLYGPAASARGLVAGANIGFNYIKAQYAEAATYYSDNNATTIDTTGTYKATGENYFFPVTAMLGYQFAAGRFVITPTAEIGLAYAKYDLQWDNNTTKTTSVSSYDGFIALAAGAGLSIGYAFTDKFALNVNSKWGYLGGNSNAKYKYTFQGETTEGEGEIGGVSYVTVGLGGTFAF